MSEPRVDDCYGTESVVMRDYRKGNWTVSETMVLVEAKKMDDERRTVKRSPGGGGGGGKVSMEPRWKWVEDYCWRKGCYRSQNQCNDKWDNLMRDYKKVRDYELRRTGNGGGGGVESSVSSSSSSYWKMEKTERKERNLPASMILQIYEALVDVVERKDGGVATMSRLPSVPAASVAVQAVTLLSPPPHQQKISYLPSPASVMVSEQPTSTLPPPTLVQQEVEEQQQRQQAFTASRPPQSTRESEDTSQEHSDFPAKRRRRMSVAGGDGGTSETADVGAAITIGATAIAAAIQASDEREERRHRDMVSLQERRLRADESTNEINRQGMNGLVEAINRLATSIYALASSSASASSSKKNINTSNE